MHSEMNHSKTEPMQFIQMWIMPDRRGLPPSIEQKQFTVPDRANRLLQLVYPEHTSDPQGVIVHRDVGIFASRLDAGVSVEHQFASGRGGYLYLIDGEANANGEQLARGDAAKITGAGRLGIAARATSELLLVDTSL